MSRSLCAVGFLAIALVVNLSAAQLCAASPQPPAEFIGHPIAADYKLADWKKIVAYFRKLDADSDRVQVRKIGTTTEGREMILAEISSAENLKATDKLRADQFTISDPRKIADQAAEDKLVQESKVAVLINCNLHSTEIASSQLSMELAYEIATSESPRIKEIRDRTVLLLVPSANPDGLDKVIEWYERSRGKPWEGTGMPWLYQKYAGHDNNRDWFMLALQETRVLTKVLYEEWRPTIVYDIHQMGRSSVRFFVPPFHDPKNPNLHPLIDQSLMVIGGHMAAELAREKKTGVVHGAIYDNFWAGGFRSIPYRHNMVGILTEAASPRIASPVFQQKDELRGGGRGMPDYRLATNFPDPWPGGWWRLRDVADYERIACLSLLTLASRYHDNFQHNYIQMGREALKRGQTEPPFAWIVPSDQRDPGNAARLLELMQATGVEIQKADLEFVADGVKYPAGTFILPCSQPYRAYLNDMFERQVYPDRVRYPGGPAEAPYDIAGWTMPLQMGVRHLAVSQPFESSFKTITKVDTPEADRSGEKDAQRYLVVAGRNDVYRLKNRLHNAGLELSWHTGRQPWMLADGFIVPQGSLVVRDGAAFRKQEAELLKNLSVQMIGLGEPSREPTLTGSRAARLGLYQPWTASMDEGWTRLVLDTHEYEYVSVHNAEIAAGNLNARYDALMLPSIDVPTILNGQAVDATEPAYAGGIGRSGVVALQDFVQAGGTLVCIDESSNLPIDHFNIPVRNLVATKDTKDFYCPGSILRATVDNTHPVGFGMPRWISAYFTDSLAFDVDLAATTIGDARSAANRYPVTIVARYGDTVLLESGWIRGEKLLADQPAVVEVKYGSGRIVLFGFRVQHRAQPHGTFPLLFNAVERSTM